MSRSQEEELRLLEAFVPHQYGSTSMAGDLGLQPYPHFDNHHITVTYPEDVSSWISASLSASPLPAFSNDYAPNMPTQMQWPYNPMSLTSSPGLESAITTADTSPGLISISSPRTTISTRCHTPMDSWGMDEQHLAPQPMLQAPVTPDPAYWAQQVSASPEHLLRNTTAFARMSPVLSGSTMSSPAMPTADCVKQPCDDIKLEDMEETRSLMHHHSLCSPPASAPMSRCHSTVSYTVSALSEVPGDLDERKRIMEEKTKLVRNRASSSRLAGKDKPKCPECGKVFSRQHNLRTHMEQHNPDTPRPFPCTKCPQSFKRTADLMRHQDSIHSEEKKFICDVCEAGFPRKDTLRRHFKVSCLKSLERREQKSRKLNKAKVRAAAAVASRVNRQTHTAEPTELRPTVPIFHVEMNH